MQYYMNESKMIMGDYFYSLYHSFKWLKRMNFKGSRKKQSFYNENYAYK